MTQSSSTANTSLSITKQSDGTQLVTGNTFPIKDVLKRHGGTWDAGRKGWVMPAEFDASILPAPTTPNREARSSNAAAAAQSSAGTGAAGFFASAGADCAAPCEARAGNDDDFGETPIQSSQVATVSQEAVRAPRGEVKLIPSINTFKVKDQIVKAGGRWKPDTKEWEVPTDFDMSIIPVLPARAAASEASSGAGAAAKSRIIHCGLCGGEGHARNRCHCPHCGTIGMHRPDGCPTTHARWKFLAGNPNFQCRCNATNLCAACSYACCRDAKPVLCTCSLKTECATHGTNCHGEHTSESAGW